MSRHYDMYSRLITGIKSNELRSYALDLVERLDVVSKNGGVEYVGLHSAMELLKHNEEFRIAREYSS